MNINLVITDIDGVWTDGGMYYGDDGLELKKFNTADSVGVAFCHLNDIPVAIITGEDTPIVTNRAAKLGIDDELVFLGVTNKLDAGRCIAQRLGTDLSRTAFIGDGPNDIPLLRRVALAGTVPSAPAYVKKHAAHVTSVDGGAGAFRVFVEYILETSGRLNATVDAYVARHESWQESAAA